MKILLTVFVLIQVYITVSRQEDILSSIESDEADIRDTETIHEDLQSENKNEQLNTYPRPSKPKKCSLDARKSYIRKVKEILRSFPSIVLYESKSKTRYVGSYRCPKRNKRTLYNLCNPCYRKVEEIVHPPTNMKLMYKQADCVSATCLHFGNLNNPGKGKCVPFYHDVVLPILNADCSGMEYKDFKLRVGCTCKAYSKQILR